MMLNSKEDFVKAHDISGEQYYPLKVDIFNATGIQLRKEVIPLSTCIQILTQGDDRVSSGFGYSHSGAVLTHINLEKQKNFVQFLSGKKIKAEIYFRSQLVIVAFDGKETFSFQFSKFDNTVRIRLADMPPHWKSDVPAHIRFEDILDRYQKCLTFLSLLGFKIK